MQRKKLKYAGIPKDVLDIVIGETYGLGEYTLKDELDKWGEDLICQRYGERESHDMKTKHVDWFHAWTENIALVLVDSMFGDKILLGIDRDPPKELLNVRSRNKKNSGRKQRSARRSKR